ncbi:glycosyltransferase family 9 protein [Pelagibius sp.]|uniref:glycosyltransferase family 9 protein n=1 Tax=Pelagibius sp. TaxID=1931238 RepID=UPI003BB0DBC2
MRLLFITATRIGDAVLSTGLLAQLLARHPGIRVTVAIGRLSAPLFQAVPGLERLLPVDKQSYSRHWLKLWGAAALTRWDIVVDLRGSATAYLLWTGQRIVIGKRRPGRHRVEELGDLLDLSPPPGPRVWLSEAARRRAAELLPQGAPVLAVAPAANWMGKQWPAERFAELAQRLSGPEGILPNARIAVFAAPHERAQAAPVLAAAGDRGIDLIGSGDLLDVAACLQRADFFCGNDSGLMHLAAASGIPTLGLFGPSPDARYRPWGAKAGFVRTPESFLELTGDGFDFAAKACFMESLTVNAAEAGARELWARVSKD